MDTDLVQLAFEALVNFAAQAGVPPSVLALAMLVFAVAAGIAMFAFKFNPAGMVLTVLTLALRALKSFRKPAPVVANILDRKADNGSYTGPSPDSGSDTPRQPSIRLPPPSLEEDPEN